MSPKRWNRDPDPISSTPHRIRPTDDYSGDRPSCASHSYSTTLSSLPPATRSSPRTGRTGAARPAMAPAPKPACRCRGAQNASRKRRAPAPAAPQGRGGRGGFGGFGHGRPSDHPARVLRLRDHERRLEAAAAGLQRFDADHLGRHDLPERRHRSQQRHARTVGDRSPEADGEPGSARSPTPTTWSASRTCRRRRR